MEYQQAILPEFAEACLPDALPERLCTVPTASDALLFSEPVAEDGQHFLFRGCDQGGLVFSPQSPLESPEAYEHTLVFLDLPNYIYTFMAHLKYLFGGNLHFDMPHTVYRRHSRHNQRIRIEGSVIVGRKNGDTTIARLCDFTPTGLSFFTEATDFHPGEPVFVSLDVPECGACEAIAHIVRVENRPSTRGFRALVAAQMTLTPMQKTKAKQIYLSKKAAALKKNAAASSQTLSLGKFHLKD